MQGHININVPSSWLVRDQLIWAQINQNKWKTTSNKVLPPANNWLTENAYLLVRIYTNISFALM